MPPIHDKLWPDIPPPGDAISVPWWQTFLCHHVQHELHSTDEVLAVRELFQRLLPEQRPAARDPVRARLLVEFFHRVYSANRLYVPIRLRSDPEARSTVEELRRVPGIADPLGSLTQLLQALDAAKN